LISIMNSSSAIRSGEVDLRIRAAKCLANFRDHESLGDLLAYRRDGVGNPLLRGLFERFGNAMGPEGALLAKAEFLGLDVQGLNGPPVRVDAAKLRERALLLMNGDQSRDSDKDRAGWILAIEDGNPQGLARLVESAKKEIEGIRPRYGNRGEVLKMIGTIDSPESKAVLIKGLGERRTAEVCAANLLFCQSEGSEPVRRMLLDELKPGKDPDKYVLADEMKWILVSVFKDDSEVRAAAQAADARSGLSDWRHYVEMRGDWPVYNWSAESVYWYRRTKLESK
jgi:hypothetical protein